MGKAIMMATFSFLALVSTAAAQTPAPSPQPPTAAVADRSGPFAWSLVGGAAVVSGKTFHSECWIDENDESECYTEEIDTGSAAVGEVQGFAGIRVSRGDMTQALGYQLHLSIDGTGILHRHSLGWRMDIVRQFYLTATLGYVRAEPFEEDEGVSGFTFGFVAQFAVWGPFVIGGHFVADGFESQVTILKTWGLTVGIAG